MTAKDVRVFDDKKGKTFDEYTIIIGTAIYGMSCNARSPQGFNQYEGELSEFGNLDQLGKEIPLLDAPLEVRLAIGDRMKGGE